METHKYLEKYFNGFLTSEEIMLTDITSKIQCIIIKYQLDHDMREDEMSKFLDLPLETINEINNDCHDFKLSELCRIAIKLDKMLEVKLV